MSVILNTTITIGNMEIRPHIGTGNLPGLSRPTNRNPEAVERLLAIAKENREALEKNEAEEAHIRTGRYEINRK